MSAANLSNIIIAIKAQSGLGVAATGAGASGLEVLSSQGISLQVAQIESQMLNTNRMRLRPRAGSRSVTAGYETELQVGNLDTVFQGVLGGTWVAAATYSNTDWGALTISGTGTILTFATGTILTDGVRAGMVARLTNMSVPANNSVWFPIISVTEGVMTIPTGLLADNASDVAWNITIAKSVNTATPYLDRYFTIEEYLADIDRSKLGTDMRLNDLNFSCAPNDPIKVGFGFGGRDLAMLPVGTSPSFTNPVFVAGSHLVLLDGGLYMNGVKRAAFTGCTYGLQAPVTGVQVVDSVLSPDVFLGQFALSGNFTGVLVDGADFDAFDAETQMSVNLFCVNQARTEFVNLYMGDMAFGGWTTPVGGEGAVIQTIPLLGGNDERGTGYASTAMLISTSAA